MSLDFFFLAILLVVSITPLTWDRRSAARARSLDRYAKRTNLALTPAVEHAVITRLLRRERAVVVGGAIGLAASAVAALMLPEGLDSGFLPLVILASTFSGIALGAAIASVSGALTTSGAGPRIARAVGSAVDVDGRGAIAGFAGVLLLGVIVLVGLVLAVYSLISKPQQHYWRRLWAAQAPGNVNALRHGASS